MKHFYFLFLFVSFLSFSQLTPPAELQSYYSGVDFTLTGNDLYDDLATETIAAHSPFLTYSERHNYLYNADEDMDDPNNVILIYSGESRYELEYESINNPYMPQTFNTEHVYPRSLLDDSNAEADLHHLRVCDITINSERGNNPFTSGSGGYLLNGGGWYPGDDWKGDVARMILYTNLRYNEPFTDVGSLNLFLQWNAEDNVSPIEDQRNVVISGAQGNRNPFIDNPYLATVIWGGANAENRWSALSVKNNALIDVSIYPNPIKHNESLYIDLKHDEKVTITIYDILGKEKLNTTLYKDGELDISTLAQGLYIVNFSSQNNITSKKLIRY